MSVLTTHYRNCEEENCGCTRILSLPVDSQYRRILKGYERDQEKKQIISKNSARLFAREEEYTDLQSRDCLSNKYSINYILEAIENILLESLKRYPRDANLCCLMAYLVLYEKSHILGTLEWIEKTIILKGSIKVQFYIFYLTRQLDAYLLLGYNNININDRDNVETTKIVGYMTAYNKCMKGIANCSNAVMLFWGILLKVQIEKDKERLCKGGKVVVSEIQNVQKRVRTVERIYGNNVHFLLKYGLFQKMIMNNEGIALEIFRKINHYSDHLLSRRALQEDLISFSRNSKMLILIASVSGGNEGTFTDTSYDLESEFEFSRSELKNRSINMLFIQPFISVHHEYVNHFMTSREGTSLCSPHQRPLPVKLKSGYIKIFIFTQRLIPSLHHNNIHFLFSCKPYIDKTLTTIPAYIQKQCLIIFDEEGIIQGVNQNCGRFMRIPIQGVEAGNKSIFDIIPELQEEIFNEKIKSDNGGTFSLSIKKIYEVWDYQIDYDIIEEDKFEGKNDIIMFWGRLLREEYGYKKCGSITLNYLKFIPISNLAEVQIIQQHIQARKSLIFQSPEEFRRLQTAVLEEINVKSEVSEEEKQTFIKQETNSQKDKKNNKLLLIEKKHDVNEKYKFQEKTRFKFIVFSFFVLILILLVIEFGIYLQLIQKYESSFEVLNYVGQRFNTMTTITLRNDLILNKLMFCREDSNNEVYEDSLINLSTDLSQLKSAQTYLDKNMFNFDKYLLDIERQDVELRYSNMFMEPYNQTSPLSQAVNIMIQKQIHLGMHNLSVDNLCYVEKCWKAMNCIDLFKTDRFLLTNGFDVFKVVLDQALNDYTDHYFSSLKRNNIGYILIGIYAFFMFITSLCILAKVLHVDKDKTGSLSIFAYLKDEQINENIENCISFNPMNIWLDEKVMNAKLLVQEHSHASKQTKSHSNISKVLKKDPDIKKESISEESKYNLSSDEQDLQFAENTQKKKIQSELEEEKVSLEDLTQKKKHKLLSKFDKSIIKRVVVKVMISLIVFLTICGINIYLLNSLYNDFTFISKYYDDIVKRSSYLDNIYFCLLLDTMHNTTTFVLENATEEYSYNYYDNISHKIEDNLLQLQKDHPPFFSNLANKIEVYNSEMFCDELQKDVGERLNYLGCRRIIKNDYRIGLRNLMFKYFAMLHKWRIYYLTIDRTNQQLLLSAQSNTHFSTSYYPFMINIMTLAHDSINYEYISAASDYFGYKRTEKIGYFVGLTIGFLLFYLLMFYHIIRTLKEDILLAKIIPNIIPIQQIFSNSKIEKALMSNHFS